MALGEEEHTGNLITLLEGKSGDDGYVAGSCPVLRGADYEVISEG
jgi:hypothetical protein